MAVRIPTSAIIPNAIIAMVSAALTLLDLIALNATLTFSQNNVKPLTVLPPDCKKELRYSFSLFAVTFFTFAGVKRQELSTERLVEAFAKLGTVMRDAAETSVNGTAGITGTAAPSVHAGRFASLIEILHLTNPWFTPGNVRRAVMAIGNSLTMEKLEQWISAYPGLQEEREQETVGVVMAGNIPMVGFHDLLCVLLTGNRLKAKLSSKDEHLMKAATETLTDLEPALTGMIELTSGRLQGFERVIATGSNNTSRYFEYYFRNVPYLIRHNRNSIAILDGKETPEELELLADDIFSYFGLGCRNVSKLWLPEGYDPASLPEHWNRYRNLCSHHKYAVNYDHNKAVMIVNRDRYTDGGFVLLRESPSLSPPMAAVHYEFYHPGNSPFVAPETDMELLQCITGHGHLPFGTTQLPELWDYADKADTISFLLKKNIAR
jgi:hypothetical protein